LGRSRVAGELTPYVGQVSLLCESLRQDAQQNIRDLGHGIDDILPDVLAATQRLTNRFELVNTRLAAPIVRARPEDRLGLLVLRFLNDSHPMTAKLHFGLTDGSFGKGKRGKEKGTCIFLRCKKMHVPFFVAAP